MAQPLFISKMMTYFDGTGDLSTALLFGGLICLGTTINAITHHPYFLSINKIGVKLRLACSGLIYKKITKLSSTEFDDKIGGQIINLLANDGIRLEYSVFFLPYMVIAPIQTIIVIIMLVKIIDVSILSGLVLVLFAIPLQTITGKILDYLR